MMEFKQLFLLQAELDSHIVRQHGLQNKNLIDRKLLALLVEIGELANETRCFKFWSVKPPAAETAILEEYVDGIHFILSLGIDLGYEEEKIQIPHQEQETLVDQFLMVYKNISDFKADLSLTNYHQLFSSYITLGSLLGFTEHQIKEAYLLKNEVNHQRQKQGY